MIFQRMFKLCYVEFTSIVLQSFMAQRSQNQFNFQILIREFKKDSRNSIKNSESIAEAVSNLCCHHHNLTRLFKITLIFNRLILILRCQNSGYDHLFQISRSSNFINHFFVSENTLNYSFSQPNKSISQAITTS